MEEIEYIPFYGELKMTEEKKPKKTAKPKQITEETLNEAVGELAKEIVTSRTEAVIEEIETSKAHVMAKVLEEQTLEEKIEEAKTWVDTPDVPEPGTTDIATSPNAPDVTRRGYTTMLMAQAARNNTRNPSDYLIVELRDVHSAILAYYVIHKTEEL